MHLRQIRQSWQRPLDQRDRQSDFSALVGDDPEKMQRLGMVGVLLQCLAVKRFRPGEPSRLVMGQAGIHRPGDPTGAVGVLFVVVGGYDNSRAFSPKYALTINAEHLIRNALGCSEVVDSALARRTRMIIIDYYEAAFC